MFITCPLCTQLLYKDHTHSTCIEHDTNIADRHIAHRYAEPEVKFAHVIMVIKYEVMLLCFQNLTPFLLLTEKIVDEVVERRRDMQTTKKGE
jgi:hypothetical protein